MAAKKKPTSLGGKVKKILTDTAKKTGKDLLTLGTIVGPGKAVKVGKTVKAISAAKKAAPKGIVRNSEGRAKSGDYIVSGKASSRTMPKAGMADAKYSFGRDTELSKNIKIKNAKSPSGKTFYTGGTLQVLNQNARLTRTVTTAEAKANARGLKAANKPTKASKNPEIKASKKIGDAGVALKNRSRGQANWEGQMTVDALRKSNPKKYKALMKESKKK